MTEADVRAMIRAKVPTEKGDQIMTTPVEFIKSNGGDMLSFCKRIVGGADVQLSEHDFVKLATEAAQQVYPGLSSDRAFAKYFEAHAEIRKAHTLVKRHGLTNLFSGDDDWAAPPSNGDWASRWL
jgi:hypothetical protein